MLKVIFVILLIFHGLIHTMGFVKAYTIANITQLNVPISKPIGAVWLLTAVLFIVTAIMFATHKELWWTFGLVAVVLSQIVIILSWSDAKFGTVPNIIILLVIVASMAIYIFENTYKHDIASNFNRLQATQEVVNEKNLQHLPEPVAKYLRYVGVLGKPQVNSMYAALDGQMRDKGKEWFAFTAEQYNFYQDPTRLFFMKGTMYGMSVPGYHKYTNDKASMEIKLFGLLPVVKRDDLFQAETVTLFNDICLMAPSRLVDKNIRWQALDDSPVLATYTNKGVTITATLYFNDKGELENFVSDDRTAVSDNKKYRFSTPVSNYRDFNGFKLPSYGEAIWHYPDGEFVYGKIRIKNVQYNTKG